MLIAFSTHLTDNSDKLVTKNGTNLGLSNGETMAETTAAGCLRTRHRSMSVCEINYAISYGLIELVVTSAMGTVVMTPQ